MNRNPLLIGSIGVVAAPVAAALARPDLLVPSLGLLGAVHGLALVATFKPSSSLWGPVVTTFPTDQRRVWLTIDDGPSDDTGAFIDELNRADARATFFVVGTQAEKRRGLLRMIHRAGHDLGCHTWSHPAGMFWSYPPAAIAGEIDRCVEVIREESGHGTTLFRPPVGFRNGFVHGVLAARDMQCIGWSARGFDGFRGVKPESVVSRIMSRLQPGAIVLLHQGRPESVEILRLLLQRLTADGWSTELPLRSHTSR